MKKILIILISVLSLSVKAQNIPVEYQGQEVFLRSTIESCPASYLTNKPDSKFNGSIKPYQPIEMVSKKEIEIYNKIKDGEPHLFIQGVVFMPSLGYIIVYTVNYRDGRHQVRFKQYKYW